MDYLEAGKNIIKTLNDAGYEAYFVGGMVRDYLLKGDVHDIDIATSALPDEVMNLFPQTHPVGIKFGMVLVISNGFSFEVKPLGIGYDKGVIKIGDVATNGSWGNNHVQFAFKGVGDIGGIEDGTNGGS